MEFIKELTAFLKNEKQVFIQTHNFPDHDAVASAFALQELLKQTGINSDIIYEGEIQRDSLKEMISRLGIVITHNSKFELREEHKIVIVDGCKGNKNVTDLIGDEIAVIDHHQVANPEDVKFVDIRPEYGACSTIIAEYYRDLSIPISKEAATALMIGINMDTSLLTRSVSLNDIEVYSELYRTSNISLQNAILRNYIQTKDLQFYRHAIEAVKIRNNIAFCYFPDGCSQNLLGILGDFLLALEEVDFVILCANNGGKINVSLRSENEKWNAARIIQDSLSGFGFGGGHADMAGGIIKNAADFNEKKLFEIFLDNMPSII